MAGRFVRSSKYRHVFGRPTKKELCYDNLHISKNAWDSNIIKVNPQYLSVNWEAGGGGAFAVIPLHERGRLPELIPLFRGHTAAVLDTDWSPFNDSLIASGSDDGKVFIWQVPDNFTLYSDEETGPKDVDPVMKLTGHTRKVGHVLFHPTAENVLATSSGDYSVKLWDIQNGTSNHALKHSDIVQSMSWSTDGNMLVTTCRDKKIRVWDPRQQEAAHEVAGHSGAKNSRAVWLTGDVGGDKIATTGFSRMSDRQLGLWDLRTLSEGPVGDFQLLDSISGVCMPFWDEGTKCLYLAGKGDGNIRYYEYSNDDFIYLSEYKSADPQRGVAFLPKRGVAVHENEVMRGFKTVGDSYIEPISFIVPRRAETFQDDIYPECPSSESALSAEAWFNGENAARKMFNLEDLYNADAAEPPIAATTTKAFNPATTTATAAPTSAAVPARAPSPTKTYSAHTPKASITSIPDTSRSVASPARETIAASPITVKPTPAPESPKPVTSPTTVRPHSPIKRASFPAQPAAVSSPAPALSSAAAPASSTEPSSVVMDQLANITALLKVQNKTLNQQNEQLKSQNDQIAKLTKEVDTLKEQLASQSDEKDTVVVRGTEELEEESKRKDERIRKLELELEEARS